MCITDVLSLLGGLALIIVGLKALREGLVRLAGPLLAGVLSPARGIPSAGLSGCFAAALLQSHSRTAAAALGLAGAGLLSLPLALGMMAGAQAGSGAAPFLLLLSPEAGMALAVAGAVFLLLPGRGRMGYAGLSLAGLGVLATGMPLLGGAVASLGESRLLYHLAQGLASPLPGLLLGAGIAGAAQSATVAVGILQLLSSRGLLGADAAFYLLLGANIGRFVPVLLASANGEISVRRAAAVSALGGSLTALVLLAAAQILPIIPLASACGGLWIVFLHFAYNIVSAALLLPFSGLFSRLALVLIRDGDNTDAPSSFGYDERLLAVPSLAVRCLRAECCRMGCSAQAALDSAARVYLYGEGPEARDLSHLPGLGAALERALMSAGAYAAYGRDNDVGRLLCAAHAMERIQCVARDLWQTVSDNGPQHVPLTGKALKDAEELLRCADNILSCALDSLRAGEITRERLLSLRIDRDMAAGIMRKVRKEYAAHARGNRHPRRFAAYLALAERLTSAAESAMEIASAAAKPERY